MGVKELDGYNGILFIYNKPKKVNIWMYNTFIPLDIIFIDEQKKIVSIEKGSPSNVKIISSRVKVIAVLEIPFGCANNLNLKPGDILKWKYSYKTENIRYFHCLQDKEKIEQNGERILGKFIEKYKSEDPNFKFELNQLIQKIKLENNKETQNLFATINSLRKQLDESIYQKKFAVQEAISSKNDELNQFKESINELRSQLEKLKFEKREALQQQVQSYANEIKELKLSCSVLRKELENLKFEKKKAVQEALRDSAIEIKELKDSSSALRNELEKLKFSKKEAVQKVVYSSSDEIKQLKNSTQSLRDELEKVKNDYEKKIKK